jgi:acylphosphatase
MPRAAARLVIEGRVQGVGYRWWAVATAERLGLAGWVRNRADGTVEALAVGEPAALDQFELACRRGPQHAAVRAVRREPAEDDGSTRFVERPGP